MPSRSYLHLLRTKPISPHPAAVTSQPQKPFGKSKRPLGDPVAPAKLYPRFVPPPPTNHNNLSLGLDVILPDEAKSTFPPLNSIAMWSADSIASIVSS